MGTSIDIEAAVAEAEEKVETFTPRPDAGPYPDAVLSVSAETKQRLATWLDENLYEMQFALDAKLRQWADEEKAYRAKTDGILEEPFVGASGDHVPLIAMAVDPIVARLDTGVFKNSPVFRFKALRKTMQKYVDSLERFVDFYQRHKLGLRAVFVPRLIECAKHGTMVFKVLYDREQYDSFKYDGNWKKVPVKVTSFEGPRIVGVPLGNFLFPPGTQDLQACPIVAERLTLTWAQLKIAQKSGKLANVDSLMGQTVTNPDNLLQAENQESSNHRDPKLSRQFYELYEVWFDFDLDGSGVPQKLCAIYHQPTQTFLQLRLNWYFHQRKPYVVIPYTVTNDSLYGLGIAEMVKPLQDTLTQWQRHALNNAYLANIRMFAVEKNARIEQKPKLFSGRLFFVDDPQKHIVPINAGADTYPSTLSERQNLIGLAEKRTGVSDYLTGRESPIVGSRATATSTLALIQEGTRRVEEVMENIRGGMAELLSLCMACWIQFGVTKDVSDVVFGGDEVGELITEFFDNTVDIDNINGMMAVELSATDASNNRTVQQQAQLAIIQVMMTYLEKTIQAGQTAMQAAQQSPQLAALIGEVMSSARTMYVELLTKYEIRNPEAYLPDIQQFLAGLASGGAPVAPGGTGGPAQQPNVPDVSQSPQFSQGGPQ
jgi:hypothetical protein